jgi:tRNA/rRNA methyltransferase
VPTFSSLNLAAAVQLAAYEVFLAATGGDGATAAGAAAEGQAGDEAALASATARSGTAVDAPGTGTAEHSHAAPLAVAGNSVTARSSAPAGIELASIEQVEHFYAHLERSLGQTDFLEPGKPKRMMERMRRLFGRAQLQREEVNILRGMLTAWDRKGTVLQRQSPSNPLPDAQGTGATGSPGAETGSQGEVSGDKS